MIVRFRDRPFRRIEARGYSTDDVEEMIGDERVDVLTEEEAGEIRLRGGAPKPVREAIEEIEE